MRTLDELQQEIHATAREKGFYDPPRSLGESVALMHSELSEALESYRERAAMGEAGMLPFSVDGKPEGFIIELADCVIRILDTSEYLGYSLQSAIEIKMAYNAGRPYRHGDKAI